MFYKILFIIGLLFEAIGQILLTKGNEFVYAQKPIDFTHWFLLLGVVFMIPKIITFPKTFHTYIGAPITIIGVVCFIGMCVLDFVWWSFPTQELRSQLASHLSKVAVIWKPFISIGPTFLNVGLFVLSLNYLKKNKIGVALIIIATFIVFFGRIIPHRLILVYFLTAMGYSIIFFHKKSLNEHQA